MMNIRVDDETKEMLAYLRLHKVRFQPNLTINNPFWHPIWTLIATISTQEYNYPTQAKEWLKSSKTCFVTYG